MNPEAEMHGLYGWFFEYDTGIWRCYQVCEDKYYLNGNLLDVDECFDFYDIWKKADRADFIQIYMPNEYDIEKLKEFGVYDESMEQEKMLSPRCDLVRQDDAMGQSVSDREGWDAGRSVREIRSDDNEDPQPPEESETIFEGEGLSMLVCPPAVPL